jgi:hypothetical protein
LICDLNSTLKLKQDTAILQEIPFVVEVLPITLLDSGKKHMIFYRPFTSFRPLDDDQFNAQLSDLKDHGINAFYVSVRSVDEADKILSFAKSHDFEGPIVMQYENAQTHLPPTEAKNKFIDYDYQPYFYGEDEPNSNWNASTRPYRLSEQIKQSYHIHELGAKVSTSLWKYSSDVLDNESNDVGNIFDPEDRGSIYNYDYPDSNPTVSLADMGITHEPLDHANYHAKLLYDRDSLTQYVVDYVINPFENYIEGLREGTIQKADKLETYYWQSWFEYPILQRAYTGFYLWNSHLDGVMPYVYQSPAYSSDRDPFNDFDNKE